MALIDDASIRIVADGFVGTNEIRFDAAEEWLYVVESNTRRISRLRVHDGSLSDREVYGGPTTSARCPTASPSTTPATCGSRWSTPTGSARSRRRATWATLLDDGDPAGVAAFDEAFAAGTATPRSSAAGAARSHR